MTMPPRLVQHTIRHTMTFEGQLLDTDALVQEHVPAGAIVDYSRIWTENDGVDHFYLVWKETDQPAEQTNG
jgi:hypothetical protein